MSDAEVVCERRFIALRNGEEIPLVVQWMKPVPDRGAWTCHLRMTLADELVREGRATGEDSTQALVLALTSVAGEIARLPYSVFWFERDDELGLPAEGRLWRELQAERRARRAVRTFSR